MKKAESVRNRKSLYFTAVIGLLALSACGGSGYVAPADIKPVYDIRNAPVPVPYPNRKPARSRAADQAKALNSAGGSAVVERGDTLYALSRRYGVPVRDIIQANGIRPPYALQVGQVLALPSLTRHIVQRGETGYSISRKYNVRVDRLMALNNIRAPFTLAVGQSLRLPGQIETAARQTVKVAQNSSRQVVRSAVPSRTPSPRPSVQPNSQPPKERVTRVAQPPRKTINRFTWPVEGQLASRFGPKQGGLHNDGINILARQGTPVRAAEDGVVAYASNALEGYGNLLLIKHSGGWVTAYAHNERLLVRAGDKIKEGQVIARVGATGGVKRPQLHFEIRKGRRALDPLQYLSRRSANVMHQENQFKS
ncbi:M23 family metallopeptidase [Kordiimonas sp. SCSIO 12610]|uniref:M23 family metallopeptidase n=1 Tax=Kordiimonas sp. SCSIO 12610 TaxID=2829597 RepID=UPI00210EDB4D|nr:M23 family metallopeptidase [Kordiimonas sp. SCSIO 12610]UTW54227.1 M23 family metallopeptidase [Kordiimonas sp. SCSIO 12610]